jgi:DNA transposition AAA+ family ATPase
MEKQLQDKILAALREQRNRFAGSDAQFARSLCINASQYSRVKKGNTEHVLSDANWVSIARKLDVQFGRNEQWQTANTPVFDFIATQLSLCRQNSTSLLLCDVADIGKTYAARHYVRNNSGSVYVDCSQVKQKQRLVRFIAKEFGVEYTGKYADVYADLVFYLRSGISTPLVILDEAGDLDYAAFLELKALWNATEGCCGWYMMGADGLREKIRRSIEFKKVGYTELFSRYGGQYQKVSPDSAQDLEQFRRAMVVMIAKANGATDIQRLTVKTKGSLRRTRNELLKISNAA